jgi:hypothetical protein
MAMRRWRAGPAWTCRARTLGVVLLFAWAAPAVTAAQEKPPSASPLTVARLKALKSTSNDPAGDSFVGQPPELRALVDALVADTSLVSPMLLFMASNTAMRLGRIEQAGFLFYAAQIRAAFDFDRYEISARPDGNNAATYLAFLKETTGMTVNPALMREPAQFAAVIARLETWEVVPAAGAHYPEFEEAKGFKLPRERWAARGREIREDFLAKFGRRMAKLLADPDYAAAVRFVQDVNAGRIEENDSSRRQMQANREKMAAAEARMFPDEAQQDEPRQDESRQPPRPPADGPPLATTAPSPAPSSDPGDAPVRVGGRVPAPKKVKHVEPAFPPGSRGGMIVELTIDRGGRVTAINVLRGDLEAFEAVDRAVRQWVYEPVVVDGRAVSVLLPVSLSPPR